MSGIDPDLFWDDDGTCYTQWSCRIPDRPVEDIHIAQAAIDPLSGRLLEPPRVLWRGTGGLGAEGPHLYRAGDWFYLLIAEGGTEYGHMVTLARSRSAAGPFEPCPHNPVLTHRSLPTSVHAVGHADLATTPDGGWIGVCHGIRPRGYHSFHVLGRETFLYPVSWQASGDSWPRLGDNGRLPHESPLIDGEPVSALTPGFSDDFTIPDWHPRWNWLRNPRPTHYTRNGDGRIVLTGSPDHLTSNHRPTWVGVRQSAHACLVTASLRIELSNNASEAGLVVWQNLASHCLIGVRGDSEGLRLFTRRRVYSLLLEQDGPRVASCEPLTLAVCATDLAYELGLLDSTGAFTPCVKVEAKFFSTEVSGLFTGVYFALYAEGDARLECTRFQITPAAT